MVKKVRRRPASASSTDQNVIDAHEPNVGAAPSSAPAVPKALATPKVCASRRDADGHDAPKVRTTPRSSAGRRDQDLLLYLFADQLNDVEDLRKATENRIRTLLSPDDWGKGVNPDLPEVKIIQGQLDGLKTLEKGIVRSLERAMRAHYLGPWQQVTLGVGEKQLARLLAAIGDPAARERPSQLWAYAGYHVLHPGQKSIGTQFADAGVAPTHQRGRKSNWSSEAKMRTYLIAEKCVMNRRSPYRPVYDIGREKYTESVHQAPCKRCGPSGSPAPEGSSLSAGHQHARAMRLVSKRILLDLWKAAKEGACP